MLLVLNFLYFNLSHLFYNVIVTGLCQGMNTLEDQINPQYGTAAQKPGYATTKLVIFLLYFCLVLKYGSVWESNLLD